MRLGAALPRQGFPAVWDYFLFSDCCRQDFFHSPGRLLLRRCCDVGVGVQREACAEMSQHPGYRLDVHSVLKGQGGKGVTEIVKPNPG